MNTSDVTAADGQLELAGKIYYTSPLRDIDFGEFERWVQDRYLDVAIRNLDKITDEGIRALFVKHAYDKAAGITIDSAEALRIMTTIDGSVMLLWLSIRRKQPEVTRDDLLRLVTDPAVLAKAMKKLDILNSGLGVTVTKKAKSREKKKRKRR